MKNLLIALSVIALLSLTCNAQELPLKVGQKISAQLLGGDYVVKGNIKKITDTLAAKLKYSVAFLNKSYTYDEKIFFPTMISIGKSPADGDSTVLMLVRELGEWKNDGFYAFRILRGGDKKRFKEGSWDGTLWVFGSTKMQGYKVFILNNQITKIEHDQSEDWSQ